MGVGRCAALLLRGSSQALGVLDLALSPRPGQFKAAGGAGPKTEPGGWDTLPKGMPQLSGGWGTTSGFYPLM